MPHFFERRDWFGNSPAIWVLAALLFVTPLGWWSLRQIRLENDVANWLPAQDPELKLLRWARTQFPAEERVYVTWDDSSLNDERIEPFIQKLEPRKDRDGVPRGGVPHVADVIEPRELLRKMQDNGVEPREAARRLQGIVLGAGPLRVRLSERTRSHLRRTQQELAAAAQREFGVTLQFQKPVEDLASRAAIPTPDEGDGAVSTPSAPAIVNADGSLSEQEDLEHDFAVAWSGMGVGAPATQRIVDWLLKFSAADAPGEPAIERCFFVPGSPVALAVGLSEAGAADRTEALRVIRQAAAEAGIPPTALKVGGAAVAATELNSEVMRAAWDPEVPWREFHRRSVVATSALVGAALAYLLVRSFRLATIVLFASLFTTFLALAIVPATGGTMNTVLVVMPSLLLAVTLSAGIHVANYWKHAAARDPRTAVAETCRAALRPCLLASLTTAIGLASLSTSSLIPVREFGLYAAGGTVLAFCMTCYAIPALLMLWPARGEVENHLDHPGWRAYGRFLTHLPALKAAALLLACGVGSCGLGWFRSETKVIRYFRESSPIVQDYRHLEAHLAGIVPVELIVRFDQQAQEETNLLDRMELVRSVEERLRRHPEITGALSLADFQPVSEAPAEDASMLVRSRYQKRANTMEDRIRGGEIAGAGAFYAVSAAAHDWKQPGDQGLNHAGDELWCVTAQVHMLTDADYSAVIRDLNEIAQDVLRMQPGATHVVTGDMPLLVRTQQAVLNGLLASCGVTCGLILAIFLALLRNPWAALVALIPNVLPITVVFGAASFGGIRIDIATMMTASIALGMAVDGTLHFLSWFQQRVAAGESRQDAVISAVMHCGPAIWQTSWAAALGLLVLVPAELLLIGRFGWLMAAMVGVGAVGDLLLLPLLVASPVGRLFVPAHNAPTPTMAALEPCEGSVPTPHLVRLDAAKTVRFASKSASEAE